MRLKVSYPGGSTHEVTIAGRIAILGRDPASDVVLNDTRCSRRHAVMEEDTGGLVVRDAGSANGISVNGRRVERARLRTGDLIQLGDVTLLLLPDLEETVASPRTTPPTRDEAAGAEAPPAWARPTAAEGRAERPPTVIVLSLLWLVASGAWMALGILVAARAALGPPWAALAAGVGLCLAGSSLVMAAGLWNLAPWARILQIAAASIGLFACPFSLASAVVLVYMLRPEVAATFSGPRTPAGGPAGSAADSTFAISLLGLLALGVLLSALGALLLVPGR